MNFLPQFLKSPEYEKRVTTQAGISEEWRDSYPFHPKLGLMKSWRVVSKALCEEREKLGEGS
jgi:hypothetical protein